MELKFAMNTRYSLTEAIQRPGRLGTVIPFLEKGTEAIQRPGRLRTVIPFAEGTEEAFRKLGANEDVIKAVGRTRVEAPLGTLQAYHNVSPQ